MTSDQRTKLELDRCYLFANRSHKVKLLVVLLGVMSSTSLFEWKLSGRGLNADSLGGMRTREQSLLVASLTRSLFRLIWQDLYFAFGSYNFATTFLATHIEDSRSGSLSCERSKSSADEDLISLKTDFFPIPKIA